MQRKDEASPSHLALRHVNASANLFIALDEENWHYSDVGIVSTATSVVGSKADFSLGWRLGPFVILTARCHVVVHPVTERPLTIIASGRVRKSRLIGISLMSGTRPSDCRPANKTYV